MEEMRPKVSVIVPVYNVERYLEECLDSILAQTLEDIEVIMVNDGSSDSSGEIMDRYAEMYPNFYAYHKENAGLGHARNYGVPFAKGDYLIFIDSDDYVTPNAYKKMYETALETGSDIVVGNVMRFNSQKEFASGLHKKVFKETILNTHITKSPELMYDTTAWNKLYKKSFWDEHQFKFPEGILYEDLPVTIPAHFLSSSTDILGDVIYYWRAREGGDRSITQQRNQLVNFTDRMKVIRMVDDFFTRNNITGELLELKEYKDLSLDILLYLNQLDDVDEEFLDTFMKEVAEYLGHTSPETLKKLNAIDRIKYYFVKQGDKQKLLEVIAFQKTAMKTTKVIKKGGNYYGDYPYRNELPEDLFLMNEEFQVVRKIETARWNGSVLKIRGWNYISKIDMAKSNLVKLEAHLLNPETDQQVAIPVEVIKRTDITFKKGIRVSPKRPLKRLYNYDFSGFEVSIDFTNEQVAGLGKGRLELWFELTVDGLVRKFRAGGPVSGKKPRPAYNTGTNQRVFPKYNKAWDLVIEADVLSSVINDLTLVENDLIIKGQTVYPLDQAKLRLVNFYLDQSFDYSLNPSELEKNGVDIQGNDFEVKVPVKQLGDIEDAMRWVGYIQFEEEQTPLTVLNYIQKSNTPMGERELWIGASPAGNLTITFKPVTPFVESIHFEGNKLKIAVKVYNPFFQSFDHISDKSLYLQHDGTARVHEIPFKEVDHQSYKILQGELDVLDAGGLNKFDIGIWKLYIEVAGQSEQEEQEEYTVKKRVSIPGGQGKQPRHSASGVKLIPYRTKEGNLSVKTVLVWPWLERGPRRQEVIRKVLYPLMRFLPMNKKTVVFQAYWGKSFSCNPRAIYEEMERQNLGYKSVWLFNNENTPISGSGERVRINSLKYYYYLATAKYFINNANFPDFYEKRNGAVEVQTMHGTPLKTMGIDVPGEVDTEDKLNRFLRRCGRWDYLVSPSSYVSDLTRKAFVYKKELLEYGYPRNDKLFVENNDESIRKLKEKIGIPLDKKVVLYAPTWRVKKSFKLQLELDKMQEELGDEYVVLLRLHYFVANNIDVSNYKGFAWNLSSYEDIQDLYLIADTLITDYSSVMFDYAILNRPILFFTYDLELYRDQLRGMYIDFEEEAPGPLARTTEEIIDGIKNIEDYRTTYGEKMDEFRKKYCEFDDGHASANLVKRVFKRK